MTKKIVLLTILAFVALGCSSTQKADDKLDRVIKQRQLEKQKTAPEQDVPKLPKYVFTKIETIDGRRVLHPR